MSIPALNSTSANAIGQLTQVANANATVNYSSFDAMGRVTASNQIMLGQTYTFGYTYNLAGSLATETYPHGGVQTIVYDAANRPYSTSGSLPPHTTQYIQQAAYAPNGAVSSYVRGNNVWQSSDTTTASSRPRCTNR